MSENHMIMARHTRYLLIVFNSTRTHGMNRGIRGQERDFGFLPCRNGGIPSVMGTKKAGLLPA